MSITCLKGAVYRIWSRSVHFEKIGKKSAKIRPNFGSNNAACRTGTQVTKKNKRRRKLSAFQRGMSWHSPIKTQGARADLVLESLAQKVEKKRKKFFDQNVPPGNPYLHAESHPHPTTVPILVVSAHFHGKPRIFLPSPLITLDQGCGIRVFCTL